MGTPAISLRVGGVVSTSGTVTAGQLTPINATNGTITATLPTPQNPGARLGIYKTDSSTNAVVVTGTINGVSGTSLSLRDQNNSIELIADNTNGGWFTLANYISNASLDARYSGGSNSGGTAQPSTTINLLSTTYGGKGDGIILNDLSVTAGNKSISSATGPFTSGDAGKLVIWLTGGTTEVGTIATVQSATQATLVNSPQAGSVAFGGPNSNGAVGTDNTGPMNSAIAAATANNNAAGSNRRGKVSTPQIHLPGGIYLMRSVNTINLPGGTIRGDGFWSTYIVGAIASGTIFTHGNYSANPSPDAFQGTGYNWTYKDLQIMDACRLSTGTEGQRTVIGIQDNGCGNIRMNNVHFKGLKYGFAGAYGSDFSDVRDCFFEICDVGSYFGPGSQQVNFSKTDWANCKEMAVFEGAPHWHIGDGSSFEDPTVAAITIEGKGSGTTRFGVPVNVSGAFYNGNFIVDGGCWFETNAGGNGRISPQMILFTGDGPFGVQNEGLTLRDCYVVSGGTQQNGGTVAFVNYASDRISDQPVIIDGLYISDPSYINTVFRFTGSASTSKPRIENVRKPSNVSLTQGNVTPKIINRDGTYRGYTTY